MGRKEKKNSKVKKFYSSKTATSGSVFVRRHRDTKETFSFSVSHSLSLSSSLCYDPQFCRYSVTFYVQFYYYNR